MTLLDVLFPLYITAACLAHDGEVTVERFGPFTTTGAPLAHRRLREETACEDQSPRRGIRGLPAWPIPVTDDESLPAFRGLIVEECRMLRRLWMLPVRTCSGEVAS